MLDMPLEFKYVSCCLNSFLSPVSTLGIYSAIAVFLIALHGAGSANYYVSTSGNDSNSGLSESLAWRTITYAQAHARAGDTIYIKSGIYTGEHVVLSNSGTDGNPIKFMGYDGTPLLDGQDRKGIGINIYSKKHIELNNIRVTRYRIGINLNNTSNMTLDSITATDMGQPGYDGQGIFLSDSRNCTLRDCSVTDATGANIELARTSNSILDNCTSYGVDTNSPVNYYILLVESHNNTIKNCISKNMHTFSDVHPGHGIGLKYSNYNNKIIDCETYGNGECFFTAHSSHDNEFVNCTAYDCKLTRDIYWNYGLVVRDGSYRNEFKNCRTVGVRQGVLLQDTSETIENTIQQDNTFSNCILDATDNGIYLTNAENNTFKNCVIINSNNLITAINGDDNTLTNSIIVNVKNLGIGNISITYSDFWDDEFSKPAGMGNIYADPKFVDPLCGDYHLKSRFGRWKVKSWVYDTTTSPCINAGDPNSSYNNEPNPNGNRIDMGAYGNTPEASKIPYATGIKK